MGQLTQSHCHRVRQILEYASMDIDRAVGVPSLTAERYSRAESMTIVEISAARRLVFDRAERCYMALAPRCDIAVRAPGLSPRADHMPGYRSAAYWFNPYGDVGLRALRFDLE